MRGSPKARYAVTNLDQYAKKNGMVINTSGALAQPEKAQNCKNDDDGPDDVNDAIHENISVERIR